MSYLELFSDQDVAMLSDWIAAINELYVDVDWPYSGGVGPCYRVRSMYDLKSLVADQNEQSDVVFTIFEHLQFPLRGLADEALLAHALEKFPDGEWYQIISLDDVYPEQCFSYGSGDSHNELRQDFGEMSGKLIGIGPNPFDLPDDRRSAVVGPAFSMTIHSGAATRNAIPHEPYILHPERYQAVIDIWRQ